MRHTTLAVIILASALVLFPMMAQAQVCTFVKASSKAGHSLAISDDGTLHAWGANYQGQLGLGTLDNPVLLTPTQVGTDTDWLVAETGNAASFSCGIKTDGTLWAWGNSGGYGIFGDGSNQTASSTTPQQVGTDSDWVAISAGYFRIIALKANGTLWAWGNNDSGTLGLGTTLAFVSTPTQIGMDNDWAGISAGLFHSLARKNDGTLWAWGNNYNGALGNGLQGIEHNAAAPAQVGTDADWEAFLAGAEFNLATKTDGSLWAWGLNDTNQLGDGTTSNRLTPTPVGTDADWRQVGYTGYASAGIKTDGTLWTWGFGSQGQLGNGATQSTTPTQVGTDTDWAAVTGGGGYGFAGLTGDHFLALRQNGELFSWGYNQQGQLGNNATADVNTPTSICNTVTVSEGAHTPSLSVYPNPVGEQLFIAADLPVRVSVFNVMGQVVLPESTAARIDTKHWPNGVYVLRFRFENGQIAVRQVVK